MKRRNVLIGFGALAAGSGALVGSGAFTQVEASRNVNLDTAGDADALLQIEPNEDYSGDQDRYTDIDGDGLVELDTEELNRNSRTRFDELLEVTNNGSQTAAFFVDDDIGLGDGEALDFAESGRSIVGEREEEPDDDTAVNKVTIDAGESVTVDVIVDLLNNDDDDLPEEVLFVADTTSDAGADDTGAVEAGSEAVIVETGESFDDIDAALGEVAGGQTIEVYPGVYDGFEVDTDDVTITAARGPERTTITNNPDDSVVDVAADDLTLSGFRLEGGDQATIDKPSSTDIDGLTVEDCVIDAPFRGFRFGQSGDTSNVEIVGNEIRAEFGVSQTENLDGLTVEDNVFIDTDEGIGLGGDVEIEGDAKSLAEDNTYDIDLAAGQRAVNDYRNDVAYDGDGNLVVAEDAALGTEIQTAIDEADESDTVRVLSGTYEEAVEVGVDDLTLEAADGAEPTVDGEGDVAVLIGADNVELTGFTLTSTGSNIVNLERDLDGGTTGVEVTDNTFTDGDRAFDTLGGTENDDLTVSENTIEDDVRFGILLQRGTEATVENNVINAEETGISHEGSSAGGPSGELVATGNEIDVADEGFELFDLSGEGVDFTITDNTIENAENGIIDVNDEIEDDDVTIADNVFVNVDNEIVNLTGN